MKDLILGFVRSIAIVLESWGFNMQSDMHLLTFLILPVVTFLFIIWLVYRTENRAAKEVIYKNFPFFKDAVDSFQPKIDYLITRVDVLEEKINKIENKINKISG